jgi:3-hydroxybutyryl-CoA dehydrogenase
VAPSGAQTAKSISIMREPAAEREAGGRCAVDPERVEHADEVVDRRELHARRLGAPPEAQVVADDAEALREHLRLRLPQPQVAEPAVHEQDRRPVACFLHPEARAVDVNVAHGATIACPLVTFEHVLVVGAGQMGGGIAQVVAASGRRVSLHDAAPGAVERGLEAMGKSLAKLAEKGGVEPAEVLGRVEAADDLVPADLMIEAVVEDAVVKTDIFRRADAVFPPEAILASNTSSIPITSLAAATSRPERVIGMHFFNPVPVLKLVEVIRGLETSDETARAVTELAVDLGKTPAEARDLPGFVSNRILMPFINEAAYALLEGVAEPEAIDTIARLGFAHPMGPLALADLIGLDTCVAIMEVLHEGLGNPKYAPCPLLRQYVQAGRLGRKAGRGFYTYS